jgi:putative intracellular protease/amidase
LPEVAHPWAVFQRAGYEVVFASIAGGAVPLDGADATDAVSRAFLDDRGVMNAVNHTASVQHIVDDDVRYAAVFLAGGHGTMWDFPGSTALATLVGRSVDEGAVVAAVCHGPAGLLEATRGDGSRVVAGKRMAAFTNDEERAVGLANVVPFLLHDALAARGAQLQPAPLWQNNVVVDGRLVTGQNPASATSVAEAVVTLLQRDRQQD